MASAPSYYQLSRVKFWCFPADYCCPSLHVRRISCSIFAPSAARASLQACGGGGFCGSSSPCCHWTHNRRRVLCKFEEDDKKATSSPSECSCEIKDGEDDDRSPFDINLAIVLAGFAFEAYNTPSDDKRTQETDPFGCKTTFLSELFVREVYDGKFWINLKNGSDFPGLDLWGTSDPYVVLRIGECVVHSKTIWATTAPVWNQQLEINVKNPSTQFLQVAAWDANLVTEHRRLGNSGVNLEHLSDGKKHDVRIELEGLGGGGVLTMEIQYKAFEDIDVTGQGWRIPLLSDFFQGNGWDNVMKSTLVSENLTVRDFVNSVLGSPEQDSHKVASETQQESKEEILQISTNETDKIMDASDKGEDLLSRSAREENVQGPPVVSSSVSKTHQNEKAPEVDFLRDLCGQISEKIGVSLDHLGFSAFEKVSLDALDVMKKLGLDSRNKADSHYVESGLAISPTEETFSLVESESSGPPVEAVQKASTSLLKQTEETLKSWAILASSLTHLTKTNEKKTSRTTALIKESAGSDTQEDNTLVLSSSSSEKSRSAKELEELRKIFGKAESAMEAWAVLAGSLGHRSFVKSAFEKLCFLDNGRTDTQVAIWRDAQHRRVVVAFRGTEQVKWKDLRTDLMVLPVSFNPERFGGKFKDEAMVHGGFLEAYDSVKNRLMSLLKASVGTSAEIADNEQLWQVYVTGHSLGGALATLFALELSTSQLSSRNGHIKVTMYNFGSPRVGNKKFADKYNKIVKDSWRVVNHRDIIPTVPRLMGYCHVAQPIYLSAGDMQDAKVNMELLEDGYQGDVIGEATPDFLIEEFMKGEKHLIEKLLQTEIAMIQSIRDGSALMQHMEDFYYISLLEKVSPKYHIMQALGQKNSEKDPRINVT